MKLRPFFASFISAVLLMASSAAAANEGSDAISLGIPLLGDQGKGNAGQMKVAAALKQFCTTQRCDFAFLLGDNFYETGVRNVADQKFQSRFEVPYAPIGIEFWAILGNHDYGYAFSRGNVQAQIEYTSRSKFWRMPTRYYSFENSGIEFIALDTVTLKQDVAQLRWLERKLAEPKKGLRVVLGHYPIHSGGLHGDTRFLRDQIAPSFCGKVDVYISGHDHHLEHLVNECGLQMILSGAAAEKRSVTATPRTQFAAETLGFAYLYRNAQNEIKVRYVDDELSTLAEFDLQVNAPN